MLNEDDDYILLGLQRISFSFFFFFFFGIEIIIYHSSTFLPFSFGYIGFNHEIHVLILIMAIK